MRLYAISLPFFLSCIFIGKAAPNCSAVFSLSSFDLVDSLQTGHETCIFDVLPSAASICQLEIKVNSFNVGNQSESEQCINGSLIIKSKNEGNTLETICGEIPEGTIFNVVLPPQGVEIVFEMVEDFAEYNLTVRQISCDKSSSVKALPSGSDVEYEDDTDDCNVNNLYDKEEFLIQSPNFPRGYPNDFEWCANIYASANNICFLELRFDEFRLEAADANTGECSNDYLEISDASGSVQRFCDSFTGIRLIDMNGSSKRIVFKSNENVNDVGFSIFVRQIPCEVATTARTSPSTTESIGGRTTIDDVNDELPSYNPISTSPATSTISYYNPFLTTSNPYFIPSTRSTSKPPFNPTISTSKPPFNPTTSTYLPEICVQRYFLSSSVSGSSFIVQSPDFPFRSDKECRYVFYLDDSSCSLQLDFHFFSLGSTCLTDYLEIVGRNQRFCSNVGHTVDLPVAGSKELTFNLVRSVPSLGFNMTVTSCPCLDTSGWQPIYSNTQSPYFPQSPTSKPTYVPRPNVVSKPHYKPNVIDKPLPIWPSIHGHKPLNPPSKPYYKPHYSTKRPFWVPSFMHHGTSAKPTFNFLRLFDPLRSLIHTKINTLRALFAHQQHSSKPTYNAPEKPTYLPHSAKPAFGGWRWW